jgi:hypothetical protein
MKKRFIIITCFLYLFIHSMEKLDQKKTNHFSIVLYGTMINVSTQSLSDITTERFIVGTNEQFLLNPSTCIRCYTSGKIIRYQNSFCTNTYDAHYAHDNAYEFFEEENGSKRHKNAICHTTRDNQVMVIVEPCISLNSWYYVIKKQISVPQYTVQKPDKIIGQLSTLTGDDAISQASKDLALCYTTALECKTNPQTIAIPTLGADVGFPRDKAVPIALNAILTFLKNNPKKYERIELVIKKQSEFAAYKKFLTDYWQKLYLFLLAHQDREHFLSIIPRDIIRYILQLRHVCMHQ